MSSKLPIAHPTRTSKIHPVPINLMRVAPVHVTQRPFRASRGKYLTAHLDLHKLGLPVINHRDGVFWVIDGQHRIFALKQNGFTEDRLDCEVYENLTDQEAAAVFRGRNNTLRVAPYDDFFVACTEELPRELAIRRAVESQGVKISRNLDDNCVSAVTALGKVFDGSGGGNIGETVVGQVVRTIKTAFAGDRASFDQNLIVGLGLVFNRYNGRTNERELASRLSDTPQGVRGILRRAEAQRVRTGNQKVQCVAAAVVDIYNRNGGGAKSKDRLPAWWKESK